MVLGGGAFEILPTTARQCQKSYKLLLMQLQSQHSGYLMSDVEVMAGSSGGSEGMGG